jgi:hypothetical protein
MTAERESLRQGRRGAARPTGKSISILIDAARGDAS